MQGKLIVFEGGEGSGKTTQIAAIQAWLNQSEQVIRLQKQGKIGRIITTREPGGTPLGQALRQILLQPPNAASDPMQDRTELLLYAADRAQHVEAFLQPHLATGAMILCDRYTDSTMAYQGYGRGLDRKLIDQLNQIATGGLSSDLTFWLDVEVTVGLARAQRRAAQDRIEQADIQFHQQVRQGFRELAAADPERIIRIDASQTAMAVAEQIRAVLAERLAKWFGSL